jgi:hypothetical protein
MIMIVNSGSENKEQKSVNTTVEPAKALGTFPRKSHIFRMKVRKVIISVEK